MTKQSALVFGLGTTAAIVIFWSVIRSLGLFIAVIASGQTGFLWHDVGRLLVEDLTSWRVWRSNCGWEAWSILRWWLLFGTLALLLGRNTRGSGDAQSGWYRRLMLFSPWIAILELGHLVGVWLVEPLVVPEPSTFFAVWTGSIGFLWTNPIWLARAVVPTLFVGLIFARAVLGWCMRWSAVFALLLVPVGMLLSVLWTNLFKTSPIWYVFYEWGR